MQTFFSSLNDIERFTQSIGSQSSCACPHCQLSDQWVSHGYVYSQAGEITGKRLVCGRRYGKNGCGRTQQLYLNEVLPHRRYRLSVLMAFITRLIQGMAVRCAYHAALGHAIYEPRQAWRWLNALWARMPRWRTCLPSLNITVRRYRSWRLRLLLNALSAWLTGSDSTLLQEQLQQPFC
ncbi:MAG: hypothetical protein IPM37_22995 [Hahellaceae bacterium]|nr:hypothetical protein [Hahellaceae bacterium]